MANGASFTAPATITITASASDSDGNVSRVDFYSGTGLIGTATSSPYAINWNSVGGGSYSLTARATDNRGATTTSNPVNITVNAPPAVSITSPANGANFTAPANITITANATDSDGSISRVDFYQGTTLIGSDTASPYTMSWNNVAVGTYSLTARATDNAGATTTSAAVSVSVTPAGTCSGPTSGLVACWKFDENTGTTAADSSGNGNTGTLQTGASWNAGHSGSAAGLDGVNGYVQVGAQSSLVMSSAASFSTWIYPTGVGSNGTYGGTILSKEGEYLMARFPGGTIQLAFANSTPGWAFINTGAVAPLNQWTHVAVSYDNGTIKTYLNGTLAHTYNGSGSIGDYDASLNDFRIGGRQGISHTFQGRIDEVRVYNRALSAGEVSVLANGTSAPNASAFVTQTVPQTITAGQSYAVSVTLKNTGSNTWTAASSYNLGAQNPQDNTTWGMARVGLPSSVAPGAEVTFNLTVTAPSTPGTYNCQWRMVQDGVEWFGDFSPNVAVTVNASNSDYYLYTADVRWIVTDQLGTPRMIFDQSGSLANVSRHDYLPFGEELANVGGRTTAQGYTGSDGARQKFTLKERDIETGLDYFLARYYGSTQGRFTSPDPLSAPACAHPNVPQSWNLYTYVLNNPLNLTDPDGLMWIYRYLDDEHKRIGIAWIEGNKISKADKAQGYQALNFGGQSSRDVTLTNGSVVRLSATSGHPLELRGPQQSGNDGGYVNAALIRELGRQTAPMPAATGAFILLSLNGGYAIAGSSIALLDAAAFSLNALHEQSENDSQVMATVSQYDQTKGNPGSIRNVFTDVSKSDFIKNMEASGYKVTKSGNATILENGANRYTVYDVARSTGGPTAVRSVGREQTLKIRLKP